MSNDIINLYAMLNNQYFDDRNGNSNSAIGFPNRDTYIMPKNDAFDFGYDGFTIMVWMKGPPSG